MRLQLSRSMYGLMPLCCGLLLCLALISSAHADVVLQGDITIGDNNNQRINPTYMLELNGGQFRPNNPIHFHLSKDITLNNIQLAVDNSTDVIDDSLYFVIWDRYGALVVDERSSSRDLSRTDLRRAIDLPAGDYRLAVVGQCFNKGKPKGWQDNCSGKNKDYEDFSFQSVTLESSDTTDSQAFIQRHHIGDSNDSDNGYADRWYPDYPEGSRVDYDFTVSGSRKLQSVTIYNYRDLIAYGNTVKLKLINKNTTVVLRESSMLAISTTGNYIWDLDTSLVAGINYGVIIQVTGWGDRDDISWDDVVIKMERDTESSVDHYRIDHPVNALTCEPASITVKACTNAFVAGGNCIESSISDTVTLVGTPETASNPVFSQTRTFIGSADIKLDYLKADTLKLSLNGITPKKYYCNNSQSADCKIAFADAGFKFSYGNSDLIADQVAGVAFSETKLTAFYNDKGQCKDLFGKNKKVDVQLGFQCQDPGICSGQVFTVDGVTLGQNNAGQLTNYSPVRLTFNNNIAPLTNAQFQDAGQVMLAAQYEVKDNSQGLKGVTIKGQSNAFWVKPDKFTINATDDKGAILNGSSATSPVIYSAAKPFTLTVTAVNRQGEVTKNYQPANPKNIEGRVTRLAPITSDSADGNFQYSAGQTVIVPANTPDWSRLTTFSIFNDGVAISTDAAYDEVGIIKFDLQDTDYYGRPIEADGSGVTIGRFTPDHFKIVESSVTNYLTAPASVGVTYMDQPALAFRYKLEARNRDGKITRNYIGEYNKAEIAERDEDKVGFVAESDGLEATDRLADFLGNWCSGVYQSGSCANYDSDVGLFSRLASGPDGPFINTYFGIKLEDTDEVKLNDLDMLQDDGSNSTAKHLSTAKSELRYGRWTIADGYGPINEFFAVTMQLEYFDGKAFTLNRDDSITTFNASAATATFNNDTIGLTGRGTFQDGMTRGLIINKHNNIGDVDVIHKVPAWLQYDWLGTDDNPAATISFGFFRGNDRVIYRRRLN